VSAETRVGNSESIDVDGQDSMALAQAGLGTAELSFQPVEKLPPVQHLRGLGRPAFNLQAKRAPFYSIAYIHR